MSSFEKPASASVLMKLALVIGIAIAIGECSSSSTDSAPEQITTATNNTRDGTQSQKDERLKICKKGEKFGRETGLIKEILPPSKSSFGGTFYEMVVDESLWKQVDYKVKMSIAIIPVCLAFDGGFGGDAIVMVKSNLTDKTLASGSPGAGTLSVEE